MKEKIAIIDLGSNSVRLVLIEVREDGSFRTINEVKEILRLSENMGIEKTLKPPAIKKTVQTVKLFKKLCEAGAVTRILPIATAAVRKAANRESFLNLLEENTGIRFEVISGEKEAALGYKAVESTLNIDKGFVVDMGGGSTEITKFVNRGITESISLPFGTVTLAEKFLGNDINGPGQIENLEYFIKNQLKDLHWLKNSEDFPVIGIGGTIRNIGKIDRMKKQYSFNPVHSYTMSPDDIGAIYKDLRFKSLKERLDVPGLSKDRADIIIPGLAAMHLLLKAIGSNRFIISGNGLREGIFYDDYLKRRGITQIQDVNAFSIDNFLKCHPVNLSHARHVRDLSVKFYDGLSDPFILPAEGRELLQKAALIHDVGITIDYYNRDEHTFYLVTNARLGGMTHRQTIMTALAASKFGDEKLRRYYEKHSDILSKEDYKLVKKLIFILSLCDKLDRSQAGVIKDITCHQRYGSILIETVKNGDAELELSEANKLQPSFSKLFDRDLLII